MRRGTKSKSKRDLYQKSKLSIYNVRQYGANIKVVGNLGRISESRRDWIVTTMYELQGSSNRYEILMGEYLIKKKFKFIHQCPFVICGKIYFLDFYLPQYNLAIEVDGSYHRGNLQSMYDDDRTKMFETIGVRVIRLTNSEVSDDNTIELQLKLAFPKMFEEKRKFNIDSIRNELGA